MTDVEGWRRSARKWERRAIVKQRKINRLSTALAAVVTHLDEIADTLDSLATDLQEPEE